MAVRRGRLVPARPFARGPGAHLFFDKRLRHGGGRGRGRRATTVLKRLKHMAAPVRRKAAVISGKVQPVALYGVEVAALPAE
eukprot:2417291-Alexandrium_andersonii.AAC.1